MACGQIKNRPRTVRLISEVYLIRAGQQRYGSIIQFLAFNGSPVLERRSVAVYVQRRWGVPFYRCYDAFVDDRHILPQRQF